VGGPFPWTSCISGCLVHHAIFFPPILASFFGSYVDRNYVVYHLSSLLTEINYVTDLLFDGLWAFTKGSPNMNSLVGFGSIAAFAISSVRIN